MTTTTASLTEDDRCPWPNLVQGGGTVALVSRSMLLTEVAQRLTEVDYGVVVVASPLDPSAGLEGMQPHGLITETEIVRACAQGQDLGTLTAEAVMVNAKVIPFGSALPSMAELATQQAHPYLLVTDHQGQWLGLMTLTEAGPQSLAHQPLAHQPLAHQPLAHQPLAQADPALSQELQTQRNYGHLIATIISRFTEINPADLDPEIHYTLRLVRDVTQVGGSYLSFFTPNEPSPLRSWVEGEAEEAAMVPCPWQFPWSHQRLQQDTMIYAPQVDTLPPEAAVDQAQWQRHGLGAVLSLPLVHKSRVVGAIGLVAHQPVARWRAETIQLLQILGKMIVATQQRIEDERQLQESEERLRLALSATNQGLYDVNLTTGEVLVSPEYATMLGYDPATFYETEEHWREMLHPEDREAVTAAYDAYIAGRIPDYRLEFRMKTKTGDWKWVLSLGKIVAWDEAGRPLRMLGTHTDIDDLKRAEEALRASEIHFRTFMDNSPMAAWITDPETNRLEYTSRGWHRNYALPSATTSSSPQGYALGEIFPEDIAQIYAHHNRWVVEHGEVLEVVEPGLRPDQSLGEFLAFKFPLPQPHGQTLVGGVAIDITERNRTEQRLALQSSILASIARTEPLQNVLTELVLALEGHLADSRCSILFCAGDNRLYPGVAPHLPQAYSEALRGTAVGEAMGSCGTAALRRQPVIVEDIAADPLWADFRQLALAHGLRACWSVPVFASDGPVLGTLAVYFSQPRRPYPHELDTLQVAANLAKVAIEQDQASRALAQLNRELEDRVAQRTEALQYSEARLKEAQQVARLGYWEMDVRTRQIAWSDEVMALVGDTQAQGHGDLRPHVATADWPTFTQLIDRTLATGEPCTADLPIQRLDGSQGWLFIKATTDGLTQGEITRIFGIAMDVSDRKAMQDALQYSEARTRATLLALPDLIFRVNREGIYLDFMASPASGNLVDPGHAVGKHLSEALPAGTSRQHLTQKLDSISRALSTQTVQCYEQVIPLNGGQRYEEVRVAPCGQDEVVFFIRNISDRKRAELELIRSRDLREAIFNESTDALFLVDSQTRRTIDCNQRAVDLFEASEKHQLVNIEGHRLQVKPFSEAELQEIYEIIDRRGVWSKEIEYRTFTGKTFWGNIATKLITVAGQQLKLVRVTDISERKHVEVALQRSNEELARATRMKDEFLANMSHELRTPLNAVLGMAEGLQDEVFGPLNPRQRKALQTIDHSGSHLLELINDILDLAKIEAGQMTLEPTPVAVPYLCASSLPFVQTQAQEKDITIRVQVPDHLPDLLVDERRLLQVLINLLNNAVKFTPAGGTVTLSAHLIDPPADGQAPWLRLTVSDTGIGIAPQDLDKLFKPFVQIDSTLNRQYSGTGLGLALVQRMVDLHGGQVQVSSEVGVGSQFCIDLPTYAYSPLPMQASAGQACTILSDADQGLTLPPNGIPQALILLVDDNEANLLTVSSYLGAKGYRLEMARTGREAVTMALQLCPDMILMDIQMPDMDGLEATQQIRADPTLANTKIVALTALAMPEDREQCLALGIDEYLSKPIKLKALAATVRTLLNHQAQSL